MVPAPVQNLVQGPPMAKQFFKWNHTSTHMSMLKADLPTVSTQFHSFNCHSIRYFSFIFLFMETKLFLFFSLSCLCSVQLSSYLKRFLSLFSHFHLISMVCRSPLEIPFNRRELWPPKTGITSACFA